MSLGEVLEPVARPSRITAGAPVRTLGVRWYGAGCFAKENSEVKAKQLNAVAADDIVYSKLFAWKGSFGVVPGDLDGVLASTEFPTFRADESMLLPAYFAIWSSRPDVWAQAEDASTGTTGNSRNRFSPDDFLDLSIELPPPSEQLAIVRAVSVVARNHAAVTDEAEALTSLRASLREHLFADLEPVPLAELATGFEGGDSPKCEDRMPADHEWGVLKVGAVRPGLFRPEEAKALPASVVPNERAEVRTGDIIMNRASGTRPLVASFCRVETVRARLLLSDLHWRVHVAPGVEPDFLVEAMALAGVREQIDERISGTTGAGKVSRERMRTVEVPYSWDTDLQQEIASKLQLLRLAERAARDRADELIQLRQGLANELVNGSRSAPPAAAAPASRDAEVPVVELVST